MENVLFPEQINPGSSGACSEWQRAKEKAQRAKRLQETL